MGKVGRSRGAVLLARQGVQQTALAERVGVSQPTICTWLRGSARPGAANREVMHKLFGIDPADWDVDPGTKVTRPPVATAAGPARAPVDAEAPLPPSPDTAPPPTSARAEAALLIAQVRQLRVSVLTDADATPHERAKVLSSCAQTLTVAGKLTGETLEVPESSVLRLPAWSRIRGALVTTLEPWPDAARAVAVALRALGGVEE